MRIRLACYDPAHLSPRGSYWAWNHPDLSLATLDELYYGWVASQVPDCEIGPNELRGGLVAAGSDWCCWYRFVNGGRDRQGRPGRWVLLCAFCERSQLNQANWMEILQSPAFQRLALAAPVKCPLAAPSLLELEVPERSNSETQLHDPSQVVDGRAVFTGTRAIDQASSFVASLAPDVGLQCRIRASDGALECRMTVVSRLGHPPERPVPTIEAFATPVKASESTRPSTVRRPLPAILLVLIAIAFVSMLWRNGPDRPGMPTVPSTRATASCQAHHSQDNAASQANAIPVETRVRSFPTASLGSSQPASRPAIGSASPR